MAVTIDSTLVAAAELAGLIACCDAYVDAIDDGSGAGTVEIRTGSKPATTGDAATGTLLATLTAGDPAFGDAADDSGDATATANAVTGDTSADATGTAGWFRVYDSDAAAKFDGTCGAEASGEDMELESTSITSGQAVNITSWTFTVPAA